MSPRPDGLRTFPIGNRETPPHKRKEIVYLERLGDRSRRTQFARHSQEVGLECITAPGHGNDGRARRELTKVSYRFHALSLGHKNIAENKVEGLLLELSNTVLAVHGHGNVIAIRLKQIFDARAKRFVVVNDKYAGHRDTTSRPPLTVQVGAISLVVQPIGVK